jgi:hypothetical protein
MPSSDAGVRSRGAAESSEFTSLHAWTSRQLAPAWFWTRQRGCIAGRHFAAQPTLPVTGMLIHVNGKERVLVLSMASRRSKIVGSVRIRGGARLYATDGGVKTASTRRGWDLGRCLLVGDVDFAPFDVRKVIKNDSPHSPIPGFGGILDEFAPEVCLLRSGIANQGMLQGLGPQDLPVGPEARLNPVSRLLLYGVSMPLARPRYRGGVR